ncbi:MAG: hypothetical protein KDJ65_34035 [Anaerolineae bacterium]|nr:hypothetical protein [Anaerolineae bacterium]
MSGFRPRLSFCCFKHSNGVIFLPPAIHAADIRYVVPTGLDTSNTGVDSTNPVTATPNHFSRWAVLAPVADDEELFLPLILK